MATSFPGALDDFTNPNSGNTLDSPSHSSQHSDANDALEAVEAKLGVGNSPAGSAVAGYALVHNAGGTTTWNQIGADAITSGTADANQVLTAQGDGTSLFGPGPGLIHINSTSFSAVANETVTAFSASFTSYLIIYYLTSSSSGVEIQAILSNGGTPGASTYIQAGQTINVSGTLGTLLRNNSSTWRINGDASGNWTIGGRVILNRPFEVAKTSMQAQGNWVTNSANGASYCAGIHNTAASFNQFRLGVSSGNMTGELNIYGLQD